MSEQTAEEFLEHFGVKGMKWGKRKAEDSGGGTKTLSTKGEADVFKQLDKDIASGKASASPGTKPPKPKSADIIAARERNVIRYKKFQEAQGDFYVARTRKGQDKAEKIMRKLEKDAFDNEDTATAAKFTTGEKVGVGIMLAYGGLAAVVIMQASKGY